MKLTDEKILDMGCMAGLQWEAGEDLISFARAILKEAGVEELERDAERYRWLIENGDRYNGLFIGHGYVGTWGECGHSDFCYKEHADKAIDEAMKAK